MTLNGGMTVLKHTLTVEESADLILYLLTSNYSFLQEIFIDGGLMKNHLSSLTHLYSISKNWRQVKKV